MQAARSIKKQQSTEDEELDFSFFTSQSIKLETKLGLSEVFRGYNVSSDKVSEHIENSESGKVLQLLKDVTSALDELTQQQLMLEMMVVKEGTFDLTEPKAWKRKIDDLKNLLEKFETVNENQSIIENILNKKYDHTFMQIQADQRRKSIEMLKNLAKLCSTVEKQQQVCQWNEKVPHITDNLSKISSEISSRIKKLSSSQFL